MYDLFDKAEFRVIKAELELVINMDYIVSMK